MAEKVLTAMSGGVDSAAAALILTREGYDVAGVTMRLYDAEAATPRSCCAPAALKEAATLARAIGIPHYVLDFREFFRRAVVEDFVTEYGRGRTPNPCIRCNGVVKFERLLALARAMGFDKIATGHYVRREYDRARSRYALRRAADESKDQSYFLWATPRENLADILFPVGDLLKSEVRELLAEAAPATRDKPESQDICFIEEGSYADFVARVAGVGGQEGPITDEEGHVLGLHKGIARYTVGQRRGLGVAGGERMYVKSVDAATNTVVLARGPALEASTFTATRVNWLLEPESERLRATAAVRFRDRGAPATLRRKDAGTWEVAFDAPRRAIAPGQSAAFYDGDVLLGGGVIEEVAGR
jgi:tRNA-specific 2-thiouridylase